MTNSLYFDQVKKSRLLIFVPLFVGYLLLYPNLILHYSQEVKYFIKYPIMAGIFLVALVYGFKKLSSFMLIAVLFLLFAINYSIINLSPFNQYFFQGVLLILLAGMFYAKPSLVGLFVKALIFVAFVLSVQAIIVFYCWANDIIIPFEKIVFVGEENARNINVWLGRDGVFKRYLFRANSYFTEASRFAYFLTPALFMAHYLRKTSIYYRLAFCTISIAIVLTFSVAALTSILFCYFLYKYPSILRKVIVAATGLFLVYYLLIPYVIIPSMHENPRYWHRLTDKSGSLATRLAGFRAAYEIAGVYPLGVPEERYGNLTQLGGNVTSQGLNSTIAFANWLTRAGIQGLLIIVIIVAVYVKKIFYLIMRANGFERAFGYGALAYLLEESFYGNYLEFYFIAIMAITLAIERLMVRTKYMKSIGRLSAKYRGFEPNYAG